MAEGRYVVVGAGIMGLWSALCLRETGHDVLLLDAWEPGHPRATSGDENRVI
ncbi:MAG: FAD-dependent oxidoreductase, partial [Candidatus Polarisedimenticolia bacterium]